MRLIKYNVFWGYISNLCPHRCRAELYLLANKKEEEWQDVSERIHKDAKIDESKYQTSKNQT
jgi:hypothetical protein